MSQIRVGLLLAFLFVLSTHCRADEPRKISFEGNSHFSDAQLLDALIGHADYLLAMHPMADATEIHKVADQLLTSGYRNGGFSEVDVQVVSCEEPNSVIARISEGPQYKRGIVKIDGCKQIDENELLRRLTQPYPEPEYVPVFTQDSGDNIETKWVNQKGENVKLEKPVWKRGDPASFGREKAMKDLVNRALKDLGFSKAFSIVQVSPNRQTRTADLAVSLIEEGEADVVTRIHIEGVETNSKEGLVNYLAIQNGQVINQKRLTEIHKKLWECGRFANYEVELDAPTGVLKVKVEEVPGVPAIDQPISQHAQIMMKTRRWLASCDEQGIDAEFIFSPSDGELMRLIQSSHGSVIEVTSRKSGKAQTFTALIGPQAIVLDQSEHPMTLRVESAIVDGKLTFSTTIERNAEKDGDLKSTVKFTVASKRDDDEPAVSHRWLISPSNLLGIAYKETITKKLTDRRLILETDRGLQLNIDRETGAILEWKTSKGSTQFARGLFEEAQNEILSRVKQKPNAMNESRAVTTVFGYLISEPMVGFSTQLGDAFGNPVDAPDPVLVKAVRKMVDGGVLAIPDALIAKILANEFEKSEEDFRIPSEGPNAKDWKGIMIEIAAGLILKNSPDYLPRDGWPMTVTREACLIAMGRGKYSGQVLQKLIEDPDTGPLCHASVAYLLSLINQDMRKNFATRGLMVMTPEHFAKDYELVTAMISNDLVMRTIASVQTLNDQELEAIIATVEYEPIKNILRLANLHPLDKTRDQSDFWFRISRSKLEPWLQKMSY